VVTHAISRAVLSSIAIALGALIFLAPVELSSQSESAATQSRIQANSNRESAGKLENGILTLHLELQQGDWYLGEDAGLECASAERIEADTGGWLSHHETTRGAH
jgi:hypothetical protein